MGLHEQRAVALRGDPGLWGALKGGALGFLTGGPAGAVMGATGGLFSPSGTTAVQAVSRGSQLYSGQLVNSFAPTGGMGTTSLPPVGTFPRPGGGTTPILSHPVAGPALRGASPLPAPTGATGAPQGYHLNKTGYWTRSGYVAPRSKWVRNRTRNVSNGKANMRALRRLTAWDKADRKRRTTLKRIAR